MLPIGYQLSKHNSLRILKSSPQMSWTLRYSTALHLEANEGDVRESRPESRLRPVHHLVTTRSTSLSHHQRQISQVDRFDNSHLMTLIEKVRSHAMSAINRTEARVFCREQTPLSVIEQPPSIDSKARLKFAESKTMKKRSKKIRRILALAGRKPRGFPEYSSYVM